MGEECEGGKKAKRGEGGQGELPFHASRPSGVPWVRGSWGGGGGKKNQTVTRGGGEMVAGRNVGGRIDGLS